MIPLKSLNPIVEETQLFFEHGIIGYSCHKVFNIFSLAEKGLAPLQMIISVNTFPLSFIIIDQKNLNTYLIKSCEKEELDQAFSFLKSGYSMYYIATFHKAQQGIRLTINTRAPLIVAETEGSISLKGWQYIHSSLNLETSLFLPEISEKIGQGLKNLG